MTWGCLSLSTRAALSASSANRISLGLLQMEPISTKSRSATTYRGASDRGEGRRTRGRHRQDERDGVRHLVVVDSRDVVGVISMRDAVALLGTAWPELGRDSRRAEASRGTLSRG